MATTVHIYPLSRLVHASPANWERQLQELEKGKTGAYSYYLPLREAVVAYCKGRGKRRDEIVARMREQARSIFALRGADPVRDNIAAFEMFEAKFYPRIGKYERSLLRADSIGCEFAGLQLLGTPHFLVSDRTGKSRYVYLHASKWPDDDLKAYLELLGVIVTAKHGTSPESIWCMDLRSGKDIKCRSFSLIRRRCESTAKLYARLTRALSSP